MSVSHQLVTFVRVEDGISPQDHTERLKASLTEATGEWVCFVDARTRFGPEAVAALEDAIAAEPDVDLFYSDEEDSDAGTTFLKPVFSPERLRGQDYISGSAFFRTALIEGIGGIRDGRPGAELYDLTLRASVAARAVAHIPTILFDKPERPETENWGVDETALLFSVRLTLDEHLAATGGGTVETVRASGAHDTRRAVVGSPLVSIIIPTRGDTAEVRGKERCLVVDAVRGIIERSTYSNVEFIIVLDDGGLPSVSDELRAIAGERVRFVHWSQPFSFSAKMNLGAIHSRGDFLLFLNDDIEVISPGWIEAMLALAQRPGAGLAGAMLYFEDETIQHAGHAYYRSDVTHIGLNSDRGSLGPAGAFLVEREVDGVTAACSMMPRSVFFEIGGFTTLLPGNFNDVDLCMKVASKGYQAYWTPHAELYHYESKSRDPRVALYEIQTAWARWEHLFWHSKYWPDDPHTLYKKTVERV